MKQKKNRVIAWLLTVVLTISCIPAEVYAESVAPQHEETIQGESAEPASDALKNQTEEIQFPAAEDAVEPLGNMDYHEFRAFLGNLSNETEKTRIQAYYQANCDQTQTVEEKMARYFTAEQLQAAETPEEMYRLFLCLMESDVPQEDKDAVTELIKEGKSFYVSLCAYAVWRRNNKEGTIGECLPIERPNVSVLSSADDEKSLLYADRMAENKYYKNIGGSANIDEKSGNLTYSRNDVSVPLKNGMTLELPLRYELSQAKAAYYYQEDLIENGHVYEGAWMDGTEEYSSLGVGWDFAVTKRVDNSIVLADGRSFSFDDDKTVRKMVYNDIKFERDSKTGEYYVQYLDGTKEYFTEEAFTNKYDTQYISRREDKYGNTIYYETEKVAGYPTRLTKIYSGIDPQNLNIIIDYQAGYTDVTRPDGTGIRYEKESREITYGRAGWNFTRTKNVDVLCRVHNLNAEYSDDKYIAWYNYQPVDIQELYFTQVATHFSLDCYDRYVFMALNEIDQAYEGINRYIFTSGKNSETGVPQFYSVKVKEIYSNYSSTPTAIYTYAEPDYKRQCKTTILDNNNVVTKNTYHLSNTSVWKTESGIYERRGETDVLKKLTTTENDTFGKNTTKPKYVESKTYNESGNYITSRTDYTYNDKDQVLTQTVTIDGEQEMVSEYEYFDDMVSSLKSATQKKNGAVLKRTEYLTNEYGDVVEEFFYRGDKQRADGGWEYQYDSNHNLVSKGTLDGGGTQEEQYEYSALYQNRYLTCKYVTDKNGSVISSETYEYDPKTGLPIKVTDGNGNQTTLEYDALGRTTREINPDGTQKKVSYFDLDQQIVVTDEKGYKLEYQYTWGGNIKEVYELAETGSVIKTLQTAEYDSNGRPVKVTDAMGNAVTISYDAFGRQSEVLMPKIGTSDMTPAQAKYYDVFLEGDTKYSMNMVISQTNKISCSYYNTKGQLVKTAMVQNPSVLLTKDLDSLYEMPADVRLVTVASYEYDDLGNKVKEMDGEGRTAEYEYDAVGNVLTAHQGTGEERTTAAYTYDKAGQLLQFTNNGTQTNKYEYDMAGRLVKSTDPLSLSETTRYDMAGNAIQVTDKNGVTAVNTYDSRNRLIQTVKGDETLSYTYDNVGNILTAENKEGKVVYEYNQNNTLKKATMPDGKSISYEYNDNQNVTQMTDYFGNKTTYAYTGDNYLASVTQDGKTTTYEYSNDGLPKAMVYPNGIKTTYAYDVLGNMTELANSKGSVALSRYTAGYDKSGNRVWDEGNIEGKISGKDYDYDSVGRLKTEYNYPYGYEWSNLGYTISNYTYDVNGNRVQKEDKYIDPLGEKVTSTTQYSYNAKNQLMRQETDTKDGSTNVLDYTYDRNGNLISRLETTFSPASDKAPGSQMGAMGMGERTAETKTATYTYDPFNQLTQYKTMSGVNASYGYYAGGLRSSKTVNGVKTGYYYDGQNIVNDVTDGTVSTNVLGATGYISRKTGDNAPNYFLYNIHTDVTQLANESGTVVKNYDYDAWGTPTKDEGAQIDNPIRYAGEYYDDESGMIYLRARYYQPEVGRFISEDPAKDGMNWYGYCSGNPIMNIDPSGNYTVGIKLHTYSDILIFGNVKQKQTGTYCNLRNIAANSGASIGWASMGRGGVCDVNFKKGGSNYIIRISFDSLDVGTYASNVKVFKNGKEVGKNDPIVKKLNSQEAYFYIDNGEYGDGSARVQAKMSTMLWILGNDPMYQYTTAALEIAAIIVERHPEMSLQEALDTLMEVPLMDVDIESIPDLIENIITKKG